LASGFDPIYPEKKLKANEYEICKELGFGLCDDDIQRIWTNRSNQQYDC
jgi:hypothetical protein